MSYCRFQNTFYALEECVDVFECSDEQDLSDSEARYASSLYDLAKEYIELYEQSKY